MRWKHSEPAWKHLHETEGATLPTLTLEKLSGAQTRMAGPADWGRYAEGVSVLSGTNQLAKLNSLPALSSRLGAVYGGAS